VIPAKPPEADFTACWVNAQPLVASYLNSAGRSPHDAEDLLQEVAQTALADFASYDASRPFLPWVLGIAQHRILHHHRTRSRDKHVFSEDVLKVLAVAHERFEGTIGQRQQALRECMKEQPARHRELLVQRYWKGMAIADIAAKTGRTANAISVLSYKIRAALNECIHRRLAAEENQ